MKGESAMAAPVTREVRVPPTGSHDLVGYIDDGPRWA
jgi:hypothetical protein